MKHPVRVKLEAAVKMEYYVMEAIKEVRLFLENLLPLEQLKVIFVDVKSVIMVYIVMEITLKEKV